MGFNNSICLVSWVHYKTTPKFVSRISDFLRYLTARGDYQSIKPKDKDSAIEKEQIKQLIEDFNKLLNPTPSQGVQSGAQLLPASASASAAPTPSADTSYAQIVDNYLRLEDPAKQLKVFKQIGDKFVNECVIPLGLSSDDPQRLFNQVILKDSRDRRKIYALVNNFIKVRPFMVSRSDIGYSKDLEMEIKKQENLHRQVDVEIFDALFLIIVHTDICDNKDFKKRMPFFLAYNVLPTVLKESRSYRRLYNLLKQRW